MFLPTVLARQIGNYDLTLPRWGSDTTSELEKENASAGINNSDSTGGGNNYIGSGTRLAMAPQFGNHVRIHTSGSWSPDSY